MEREKWLDGWSARAAAEIAAATGGDPAVVFGALDKMVREHLAERSVTAQPLRSVRGR